MRLTTTVVFPLPAPARISTGPSVRKTASRCFSFILQKRFSNTARRSSKKRCSKVCDMIFTKPFFYRNQILTIYPAFQSKGILKGHYSIFALKNPLPNCPTGKRHTTKNGRGTSHPFYCLSFVSFAVDYAANLSTIEITIVRTNSTAVRTFVPLTSIASLVLP